MGFKLWLVEHHVKQKEIAELLGISQTHTNLKVNGKQPWTVKQIEKICDTYGISANLFFAHKVA